MEKIVGGWGGLIVSMMAQVGHRITCEKLRKKDSVRQKAAASEIWLCDGYATLCDNIFAMTARNRAMRHSEKYKTSKRDT